MTEKSTLPIVLVLTSPASSEAGYISSIHPLVLQTRLCEYPWYPVKSYRTLSRPTGQPGYLDYIITTQRNNSPNSSLSISSLFSLICPNTRYQYQVSLKLSPLGDATVSVALSSYIKDVPSDIVWFSHFTFETNRDLDMS
jgi:hypothetical protein